MIRLLGESDSEAAVGFLDRDHEINLIMIFDIQNYGIENRGHLFQGDYYGVFKDGVLCGVACLFNFGSMWVYAPDERLMPELVGHMAQLERKPGYLISRSDWAEAALLEFEERGIEPSDVEEQEYLVLTRETFEPRSGPVARSAEHSDLVDIMRLHRAFQMEYFGRYTEVEEEMGRMAEARMEDSGITVAEFGGEIASKAEVLVHTSRMALIGGVYTVPEHRGKGLSRACMSLLCEKILERGDKACLNVADENLPAQSVYRGLGFTKICDYKMAMFPSEGR